MPDIQPYQREQLGANEMMDSIRKLLWLALVLSAGCLQAQAQPTDLAGNRLSVSAFGTLGVARSDNDRVQYVRDLSQREGLSKEWSAAVDSVIGAQANLKLGESTEAVVQAISRYRYDGSHRPEISWAYVRHEFTPDLQIRLGRLGTEFYMQADSRLVGYANMTVRPPPDFFGPLIFSYFDGGDISGALPLGPGLLRGKFFYGRSPETSPFYAEIPWRLEGTQLKGGYLDYFVENWQFRVGRMQVKFSNNELPLAELANPVLAGLGLGALTPWAITTAIPELSTVGTRTYFDSLGTIYDRGPLRVHAMVGRIKHQTEAYEDSKAGFIVASYRFGEVTPYLGYSKTRSKATNVTTVPVTPLGAMPLLTQIAQGITSGTHTNQHTTTLGFRWDFQRNMALKFQLDEVRGARDSVFSFRGTDKDWDGHLQVLSATLDFAF